jgi:hypothetical protein
MALASSLIKAAQKLIDTFGNDASMYGYSAATKTTNEEGDVTVTNWGTASTIKMVDGGDQGQALVNNSQGREVIGQDDKIIRDDVSVALNDRINYQSKNYRVTALRKEIVESTVIIQIMTLSEVTDISQW